MHGLDVDNRASRLCRWRLLRLALVGSAGVLLAGGAGSLLTGCAGALQSSGRDGSQLPVTRVVLYQNGVGYFERSGKVDGSQLTVQARPSQINDLLKSLTVIDRGSGRAVSASLPLEQTADRLSSELPAQVRDMGGLLDMLRLLRGARVELKGDYGMSFTGRVIGVEDMHAGTEGEPPDHRVALKRDGDEVVVVPVLDIRRVILLDSTLSVGLDRSLDVSLGEGGWKPVALSIRLGGEAPHDLVASYVVEMPRWKPAYRLVLGEEKPLLQGWAVVDNVSGEHWNDVRLSLVSGTPLSFKYDLHAPQYTERVDLTPERPVRAAAPPPQEQAGYEEREAASVPPPPSAPSPRPSSRARAKKSAGGFGMSRADEGAAPRMEMDAEEEVFADRSASAYERQMESAPTQEVGTLFRYDVADRVTIPDRSSTLVNIVNERIGGEEVVYFRPELHVGSAEQHPYSAVKLDNATGLTLETGPITVYSQGTFLGEGFLSRLESGATSFLTFAVDARVSMNRHGGTREETNRLLRISHGQLIVESQRIRTARYEVKNRRSEAIVAYVRTEREPGWELKQQPSGSVEMPDALAVPLKVAAQQSAELELEWVRPVQRTVGIDSQQATELLRVYLESSKVAPALREKLNRVLEIQRKLAELRQQDSELLRQYQLLSNDQERVRENLNVLRKTKNNQQLEQELSRKLAEQERKLGVLAGDRVQLSEQMAALQAELNVRIQSVSLEDE